MKGTSGNSWNHKNVLWAGSALPGAMATPNSNVRVVQDLVSMHAEDTGPFRVPTYKRMSSE